jgi:hypothetical protein
VADSSEAAPADATQQQRLDFAKRRRFRTRLAIVMAAVAVLGAIGAYRAAVAEEDASTLARTLDQGQLLELYTRQQYIDDTVESLNFQTHRAALLITAQQEIQRASRSTDASTAQRLNLVAQTNEAIAQTLRPYEDFFYHAYDPQLHFDSQVAKRVAFDLGGLGFPVVWNESAAKQSGRNGFDIWTDLQRDVRGAYRKVSRLSLVVVVFVLALFTFTVADLSSARWRPWWVAAGGCLAVLGIVTLLLIDPAAWPFIVGLVPGFAVVVVVGLWVLRRLTPAASEEETESEPWEFEPRHFTGAQVHMRRTHDRFSRGVVMGIAVTAVLSAVCGYAYSVAAGNTDTAISAAFRYETEMFRVASSMRAAVNTSLFPLATYQEMAVHLQTANAAAMQRNYGFKTGADPAQTSDFWRRTTDAWTRLQGTDFSSRMAEPDSPVRDAYFPELYVNEHELPASYYNYGMWDWQNVVGLQWRQRSAVYLAALSLFAIALYLFGQSLGMRGEHAAYILVAFASLVALGGVLYAGTAVAASIPSRAPMPAVAAPAPHSSTTPAQVPDECMLGAPVPTPDPNDASAVAAIHFGCAKMLYAVAHAASDYKKAEAQFALATRARPDFALAQYGDAESGSQAASPQGQDEYSSVLMGNPDDARSIVETDQTALRVARDQGLNNPSILNHLGFDTYWLGLLTGDRSDLERSITIADEAMRAYERYGAFDASAYYNAALARLADGQLPAAEKAYFEPPADYAAAVRADRFASAAALSDLEVLAARCQMIQDAATCKQIESLVPALKADVVRTAWPSKRDAGPTFALISARVLPGGVEWRAKIAGWDPKRDAIVAVWYRYIPAWKAWTAVSDVSGDVSLQDATRNVDGSYTFRTSYLAATDFHDCLGGGQYQGEFYVDGRQTTPRQVSDAEDGYHASIQSDMNVGLCLPAGWVEQDKDAGVYRLFYSREHTRGALLVRWLNPDGADQTMAKKFAAAAIDGALDVGPASWASCSNEPAVVRTSLEHPGRAAVSQVWFGPDDIGYQLAVLERGTRVDATACAILDSVTNLYTN